MGCGSGGAHLDVEEHAEGEHRDHEDDAEEQQVVAPLGEHARHQAHLRDDDVGEIDDLQELDAHAETHPQLRTSRRLHHLPSVEEAELEAQLRRARLERLVRRELLHHQREVPVHERELEGGGRGR